MAFASVISGELPDEYIMIVYVLEICLCFYGIYTLYKLNFSSAYKSVSNNERLDNLIMSLLNIVISLLFVFVMLLVVS